MAFSKIILNGTTLMDVTQDTVTAGSLLSGYTATGADGESVSGSLTAMTTAEILAAVTAGWNGTS